MSYSFYVNFSFSNPVVLKKKILKICFPIGEHVKTVSPIVAPPDPRGLDFNKLAFKNMSESFHVNFIFSGPVVLEKIFK
jgi:hypothetical protein